MTAAAGTSPVRRSRREKRQAHTVYDDARQSLGSTTTATSAPSPGTSSPSRRSRSRRGSSQKPNDDGEDKHNDTETESIQEDDDANDDVEEEEEEESSSDNDDDDEDEAYNPASRQSSRTTRSSPRKSLHQKTTTTQKKKKTQVMMKPSTTTNNKNKKRPHAATTKARSTTTSLTKRGIQTALASLSRKVLEPDHETPETSLVAALLHSYKVTPQVLEQSKRRHAKKDNVVGSGPSLPPKTTPYTPQLEHVARQFVAEHVRNPNKAQIKLLNLLFRSVGGSYASNLNADAADDDDGDDNMVVLEDMDNDQWGDVITTIVDEMRHTPVDCVLVCADPSGAAAAAAAAAAAVPLAAAGSTKSTAANSSSSVGVREYRNIYQEFWRVLGDVALSETIGTPPPLHEEKNNSDNSNSDNSEEEDDPHQVVVTTTTTSRFNTELVSEVINRIIELVSVGQPDVRAAATIAALQLGHAVLDRTLVLQHKYELAQRQFAAATKNTTTTTTTKKGGGRSSSSSSSLTPKAQSYKHQMEDIQRSQQDLQEIVVGPLIQGVFMHRYRDSNPHIRTMCIQSLSQMTLQRPDIFLTNKYLKYFGWMLNDKAPGVRLAALQALLAPFGNGNGTHSASGGGGMDVTVLEGIIGKFRNRIVDCLMDTSPQVQERAMSLLLALLREGFLDDVEDNDFWQKINLMALTQDTTPLARRDALYFIMEQLEPFDDGDDDEDDEDDDDEEDSDSDSEEKTKTKRKQWSKETKASLAQSAERTAALRIESLASWTAHALTDGAIPIEKIRVELVDLIVHSLRDMPEHQDLATNWSAMLRAISDDSATTTTTTTTSKSNNDDIEDSHRLDSAKERILVQMLASAAHAQVGGAVMTDTATATASSSSSSSFLAKDIDSDYMEAMVLSSSSTTMMTADTTQDTLKKRKGKSAAAGRKGTSLSKDVLHESLSVSLLESLPKLMRKFKSDSAIIGSLSGLPRYLLPSVLSLPQRKKDFTALMKILSEIYLETADDTVLQNTALSLTSLSKGDHARAVDARLHLQRITVSLRDRIIELLEDDDNDDKKSTAKKKRKSTSRRTSPRKRRRSGRQSSQSSQSTMDSDKDDDDDEETSKMVDIESAIYVCLKRFRILSKRCNIADVLENVSGEDDQDGIQSISNAIVKGMDTRLVKRKIAVEESEMEEEEIKITIPEIWTTPQGDDDDEDDHDHDVQTGKSSIHTIVAKSIDEALSFLVSIAAWQVAKMQQDDAVLAEKNGSEDDDDEDANMEEDDNDAAVSDHILLQVRKQLIALLELCFDHFLHDTDDISDHTGQEVDGYSKEHTAFAESVQISASTVAGDLRTLFLKEWVDAASPVLRACALSDDTRLIGGSVRYFRSKEEALRAQDGKDEEDIALAQSLLLPLSRGITMNWTQGNRREAGVALAHLTGSGSEASALVSTMSRLLKKIEPVRLLEAHMASLRQSYEDWMDNEPEDLDDEGTPTDEEMAAFEEDEKKHAEMFQVLDHQAARLSNSLGVGKLSDPKLTPALLGFVREGVRFAFSNSEAGDDEDDLLLGGRLTFLIILGRYVGWIRKNKEQKAVLQQDVNQKERYLRSHEDFEEVHEDDLKALADFRSALGLEPWGTNHVSDGDDEDQSVDEHGSRMSSNSMASRSTGVGSSRFSRGTASVGGGSSVTSKQSKMSQQSSLSPVSEEDDTIASDEEEESATASLSPTKLKSQEEKSAHHRKKRSLSSRTRTKSQITIDEELDVDEDSLMSPRREIPEKADGEGPFARSKIAIDEDSI